MSELIVGILRLNSLETKSIINKPKFVKKKFYSLFGNYGTIWVKTDRIKNEPDQYVVIKLEKDDGVIIKYIGEVAIHNEQLVIETCAMLYRSNKINKTFQKCISDHDITPNRTCVNSADFTISIDPDGSIDIDDAIGIKKVNDMQYNVYIYIADPTSYIVENSELDIEIRKRCESVYLSEQTYHMLPDILAQRFSLQQNVVSRAFTVELIVSLTADKEYAHVDNVKIYKTLIKVDKNTTYAKANDYIKDSMLLRIGFLLAKDKTNFDVKKMVETYMILANFYVANILLNCEGSLLRIQNGAFGEIYHENKQINEMRYKFLNERAYYVLNNNTQTYHASLDLPCYTHFTSPIRRYADIIVHRQLYNILTKTTTFNLSYVNHQITTNLNLRKTFYKKVADYETKIGIINMCHSETCMFIQAIGIVFDMQIISDRRKLKIMTTECEVSSIVGKCFTIKTDSDLKIALFESIKFKLCLLPNDAKKIRAYYNA